MEESHVTILLDDSASGTVISVFAVGVPEMVTTVSLVLSTVTPFYVKVSNSGKAAPVIAVYVTVSIAPGK